MKRSVLLFCLLFSVLLFAEPMPNNPDSLPYGTTPRVDIDHRPVTITLPTYYMPMSVNDLVEMLNQPSEVALPPAKPTDVYVPMEGETLDYMCFGNQVPSGKTWQCVHMIAQYNSWLKRADAWKKEGNLFIPNVVAGSTELHGLGVLGIAPALNRQSESKPKEKFTGHPISPWEFGFNWNLLWAILALLGILAALAFVWLWPNHRRSVLRRLDEGPDPTLQPVLPGGVTEENRMTTLQNTAVRSVPVLYGRTPQPSEIRIENSRMVRMYGPMVVEYAGNRQEPKRYNGEVGYEATAIFPGGRRETIYTEEACGNPVRFGRVLRYITGEDFRAIPMSADEIARHNAERFGRVPVAPTTTVSREAAPAETPTQQASTPAPEVAPVAADGGDQPSQVVAPAIEPVVAEVPEEVVPAKVSFTAASRAGDSHLIRANHGVRNLTVTVEESEIVIRFREK